MRSAATISGLLLALGVGYFLYTKSVTSSGGGAASPQEQVDVMGVRTSLLNIGQAQRAYLMAHGTYGTLEQLQQEGPPGIAAENRGYAFSVDANGARSFTATATPTDANRRGWPTLVIDETMTVSQR
jgi:hypothetical protein